MCRPRTGAWIETCTSRRLDQDWLRVAPRTGAWIETSTRPRAVGIVSMVAPRTGAWIETSRIANLHVLLDKPVAPRTGAWIETRFVPPYASLLCRSPHGGVD